MDLKIVRKCLAEGATNPTPADIEHFHWIEDRTDFPGTHTREELYDFVRHGGYAFIVNPEDPLGNNRIPLMSAKSDRGIKYLYTAGGAYGTDYLLELPDCR